MDSFVGWFQEEQEGPALRTWFNIWETNLQEMELQQQLLAQQQQRNNGNNNNGGNGGGGQQIIIAGELLYHAFQNVHLGSRWAKRFPLIIWRKEMYVFVTAAKANDRERNWDRVPRFLPTSYTIPKSYLDLKLYRFFFCFCCRT